MNSDGIPRYDVDSFKQQWNDVDHVSLSTSEATNLSLCACHNLPELPQLYWPRPEDLAKGLHSHGQLLTQHGHITPLEALQDIYEFLVHLSLQRLSLLEQPVRAILQPAITTMPTLDASLVALQSLAVGESPCRLEQIVALLFLAYAIMMLSVEDHHRDKYAEALFLDATCWTSLLNSASDKQAFEMLLQCNWLPSSIRSLCTHGHEWASCVIKSFCPRSIPIKALPTDGGKDSFNAEPRRHYELRTGVVARICQNYIDCESTFRASYPRRSADICPSHSSSRHFSK